MKVTKLLSIVVIAAAFLSGDMRNVAASINQNELHPPYPRPNQSAQSHAFNYDFTMKFHMDHTVNAGDWVYASFESNAGCIQDVTDNHGHHFTQVYSILTPLISTSACNELWVYSNAKGGEQDFTAWVSGIGPGVKSYGNLDEMVVNVVPPGKGMVVTHAPPRKW
jgi:hypothetical protein